MSSFADFIKHSLGFEKKSQHYHPKRHKFHDTGSPMATRHNNSANDHSYCALEFSLDEGADEVADLNIDTGAISPSKNVYKLYTNTSLPNEDYVTSDRKPYWWYAYSEVLERQSALFNYYESRENNPAQDRHLYTRDIDISANNILGNTLNHTDTPIVEGTVDQTRNQDSIHLWDKYLQEEHNDFAEKEISGKQLFFWVLIIIVLIFGILFADSIHIIKPFNDYIGLQQHSNTDADEQKYSHHHGVQRTGNRIEPTVVNETNSSTLFKTELTTLNEAEPHKLDDTELQKLRDTLPNTLRDVSQPNGTAIDDFWDELEQELQAIVVENTNSADAPHAVDDFDDVYSSSAPSPSLTEKKQLVRKAFKIITKPQHEFTTTHLTEEGNTVITQYSNVQSTEVLRQQFPWFALLIMPYDGQDFGGMPPESKYGQLNRIDEVLTKLLEKDTLGIKAFVKTGNNERQIGVYVQDPDRFAALLSATFLAFGVHTPLGLTVESDQNWQRLSQMPFAL